MLFYLFVSEIALVQSVINVNLRLKNLVLKKIIFGYLFLMSYAATSQNISYGPVIGANFYDIEIAGPVVGGTGGSYFNFGGFFDYKITNRFGVKSQLIFTNSEENRHDYYGEGQNYEMLFSSAKLNTLQLHSLAKFDVRKDYKKGFYFLGGFRMTNVLDATSDQNEDLSDFYEKINFGALFGFGTTFLKNFSVELVGDYSLTKTIAYTDYRSKNFGCYINLLYNLEPVINKK